MSPHSSLLLALAWPAPLTFEQGATALPALLKGLGAEIGAELKADPRLREARVAVRFDGTDPERALALVAEALEAEWVPDGSGRLIRPRPGLEAERRKELETRMRQAIEKAYEGLGPIEPWTLADAERFVREGEANEATAEAPHDWEAVQRRRRIGPSGRLLRRVIQALPVPDLAQAMGGRRTVYAQNPTRMQRRLPAAALEAIRDYRKEIKMTEGFRSRLLAEADAPPPMGPAPDFARVVVQGAVGALTVMVSIPESREHGWTLQETLAVADFQPDPGVLERIPKPEGDLRLSEAGRLVLKAIGHLRPDQSAAERVPMTDAETEAFRALFTDLVRDEPLSWIASDILLQSARALDRDMVAVLPDFAFFLAMTPGASTEGSLRSALATLLATRGLTARTSGEAILVGVADPGWGSWSIRREAASRYVNAQNGRPPSLECEAELALACDTIETYTATKIFSRLAFLDWDPFLSDGDGSWRALRLYGSLSPNERRAAEEGGFRRPVFQCPPSVRRELAEMLHAPNVMLTSGSHDGEGEFRTPIDVAEGEPTSRYPDGIPRDAVLEVVVTQEPRVFVRTEYSPGFTSSAPTTARRLADEMFWESRDTGTPRAARTFAMATLVRLDVTLKLEKGVTLFSRHDMPPALAPKDFGPFEGLPEAVVAEVRERLRETEERYKDVHIGPPPRKSRP